MITTHTKIYALSLHDALPISINCVGEPLIEPRLGNHLNVYEFELADVVGDGARLHMAAAMRSEEHTSELQSRGHLVCRLLLEKKKIVKIRSIRWGTREQVIYS